MRENGLPYDKNTGFRVPEGYFSQLEARILDRLTETPQGLPESASHPFRVPDPYFDTLEERVLAKIEAEKKAPKVIPLLQRESFYYAAGVAAVVVSLVGSFFFSQPAPLSFEDLDVVSMEKYLEESFDGDSPEGTRLFSEDLYSFAPPGRAGLDQEAVMEYLQENLEDPSVILNEN